MTDVRLAGWWLNTLRFMEMDDATWRVFTGALMWSAEQGTDGLIPERYVRTLHPDGPQPAAVARLEELGLWERSGKAYQLFKLVGES